MPSPKNEVYFYGLLRDGKMFWVNLYLQSTPIGSLQTAHEVISPHREQRHHPSTTQNNPARPAKVSHYYFIESSLAPLEKKRNFIAF